MKNLMSKLLLVTLITANAGSLIAMQPQIQPEVKAMQAIYFTAPDQTDFAKAKELINAIPADRINEVDNFVSGNILDLVNWRNDQYPRPQYKELIQLLEAKGAIRANTSKGFDEGFPVKYEALEVFTATPPELILGK